MIRRLAVTAVAALAVIVATAPAAAAKHPLYEEPRYYGPQITSSDFAGTTTTGRLCRVELRLFPWQTTWRSC